MTITQRAILASSLFIAVLLIIGYVSTNSSRQENAYIEIIQSGDLNRLQSLIDDSATDPLKKARVLNLIGYSRSPETLAVLLRAGANIDTPRNDGLRNTLLHFAAFIGDIPLVKAALDAGANPNASNARGDTPLILAVRIGSFDRDDFGPLDDQAGGFEKEPRMTDVVRLLIQKGAAIASSNEEAVINSEISRLSESHQRDLKAALNPATTIPTPTSHPANAP